MRILPLIFCALGEGSLRGLSSSWGGGCLISLGVSSWDQDIVRSTKQVSSGSGGGRDPNSHGRPLLVSG